MKIITGIVISSVVLGFALACESRSLDKEKGREKVGAATQAHSGPELGDLQPRLPGAIRIRESKPVTVNDATFVAVAQTDWQPPAPIIDKLLPIVAPIDVKLRITNNSKKEMLFPTFKSFGVRMTTGEGKEVKHRNVSSSSTMAGGVLLPGGASYCLWRRAHLRMIGQTSTFELVYFDGSGSEAILGPLEAGVYKLVFWYSVPEPTQIGEPPTWIGKVTTQEVVIDVLPGTTVGCTPDAEKFPEIVNHVRKIIESKPAMKNDLEVSVAVDGDWKLGKSALPIEFQLRITNLKRNDTIFFTSDIFFLELQGANGKAIKPHGGGNGTLLTLPVLIPSSGSYSICRRAEVRLNSDTGKYELAFWDGMGSVFYYELAVPGRHMLRLHYGVSSREAELRLWSAQQKRMRAFPVWLGQLATNEVAIEIHNP